MKIITLSPWKGLLNRRVPLWSRKITELFWCIPQSFTVFEISQPEIVALYREYLLRLAEKVGFTGIYRTKIKSRLRELIQELEA